MRRVLLWRSSASRPEALPLGLRGQAPAAGAAGALLLILGCTAGCLSPRPSLEKSAPPRSAPEPEAARGRILLDRAHRAIDRIEAEDFVGADREIGELREAFPGDGSAELFERFLRSRLERTLAAKALEAQSTEDSWAASAKLEKARELLRNGRYAEARGFLEEAYALDPGNVDVVETLVGALKKMGLELYSRGDSSQASEQWRRVLEIRPEDAEALRFLKRADAVNRKL